MDKYNLFRALLDVVGDWYDIQSASVSEECGIHITAKDGDMGVNLYVAFTDKEDNHGNHQT